MERSSFFIAIRVQERFLPRAGMVLMFVTGSPDYLTRIEPESGIYWGKKVECPVDLDSLNTAGQNVLSLVKRICPDERFDENSLVILPDASLCKIS